MVTVFATRDIRRNRDRRRSDEEEEIIADIVQVNGTVRGSKGWRWLNFLPEGGGQPGEAFNFFRIQERAGLRVKIQFIDDVAVIIGEDFSAHQDQNITDEYLSPEFAQHAPDHEWGSGDPSYISTRQIIPLMIKPVGANLKVKIYGGYYHNLGTRKFFAGTNEEDLSASQPVTLTKIKVGLYLDQDNVLQTIDGITVARSALSTPEPDFPKHGHIIGVVILYGDQTFIDFKDIKKPVAIWNSPAPTILQVHGFS